MIATNSRPLLKLIHKIYILSICLFPLCNLYIYMIFDLQDLLSPLGNLFHSVSFDTLYLQIFVLAFNLICASNAFFEFEFDTQSQLFIAALFSLCFYRRLRRIKFFSLVSLVISTFIISLRIILFFVSFILYLVIDLMISISCE